MSAKKIFVGNYKGGVGKTTSIYQIAMHLASLDKKVLLIDLDPQCSLSEICLRSVDLELENLNDDECLNNVYDVWNQVKKYPNLTYSVDPEKLIKKQNINLHFIPSNNFYKNGGLDNLSMQLNDDFQDLFVLQQFFSSNHITENYDYILFDCPPSNNIITQGAFLLSDYYIIPSIIQTMSIRGVVHYINTVEKIYTTYCESHYHSALAKSLVGNRPVLLGIFETLKKGTVKNDEVLKELKNNLKDAGIKSIISDSNTDEYVFQTIIQNYEDIARDTAEGRKRDEYADLTEEILVYLENYIYTY